MGQIKLIGTLVLISLFAIAILSYAENFAYDNDSTINIADDEVFSQGKTRIEGNFSDLRDDSEETYTSILQTTINGEVAPSTAPFSINSKNSLNLAKNVFKLSYQRIFGTDTGFSIFYYSLISFITFILGLFIYKTLRGNPD
jgi:hypothetical protein